REKYLHVVSALPVRLHGRANVRGDRAKSRRYEGVVCRGKPLGERANALQAPTPMRKVARRIGIYKVRRGVVQYEISQAISHQFLIGMSGRSHHGDIAKLARIHVAV